MKVKKIIRLLLLSLMTVAVAACSKEEEEPPFMHWSTGYYEVDYLQYMIDSADGYEVVYDNGNPFGVEGVVVVDAGGGTLQFTLGANATKVLREGGSIPVTSHVFSLHYCIELEFDEMEEVGVLSSAYLLGKATDDTCVGYVDIDSMNNQNGRHVQLPSATFTSKESESGFEVILAPNTTTKPRYILYQFASMDWMTTGGCGLIICQPAIDKQ